MSSKGPKLTDKLRTDLLRGVKQMGSYDPEEVIPWIEEYMTFDEIELAEGFLKWIHEDEENRCFGRGNIEQVWERWQNECAQQT